MDRVSLDRRTFAVGSTGTALMMGLAGVHALSPSPVAAATEPDWRDSTDVGMIGRRSYESPTHGITVSWSRRWELDGEVDPPVSVAPEGDAFRTDFLSLVHDPGGNVSYFQLSFMDRGKTTIEKQLDWTLSDDGLSFFFGDPDGGRVLATRTTRQAGQVRLQYADAGPVIAVTAIRIDATLVSCTMSRASEDVEEIWTASQDVLVNDDALFQIVDWPEIEAALAELTSRTHSPLSVTLSGWQMPSVPGRAR